MINISLYRAIKDTLGWVQVLREDEAAQYSYTLSPTTAEPQLTIAYSGEEYRCNCPFCGDNHGHLYINHLYETQPDNGPRFPGLAHCHHGCLENVQNRIALRSLLLGLGSAKFRVKYDNRVLFASQEPKTLEPLDNVVPITDLPDDHAACQYLCQQRGYDKETLKKYDVGYCETTTQHAYVRNSIIIPIIFKGKFSGWQARYIGEPPKGTPKYYIQPGMRKSTVLYGYDLAIKQPYIVIVEGVTDVWRVGESAVCGFGKHLSSTQRDLLWRTNKPLVVLLDPDAEKDADKLVTALKKNAKAPVISLKLPESTERLDESVKVDPGNTPRNVLISLVEEELYGKEATPGCYTGHLSNHSGFQL